MESHPLYCDVSLPVPLDQVFTYSLPETLRHRVQTGSRVLAPFGARKLAGVVLRTHNERPPSQPKELLRLLDEEPALDDELLKLGAWISSYYCAPLGEVLRAMTPLAGDLRRGKIFSLTKSGRDAARQLHFNETNDGDPAPARCPSHVGNLPDPEGAESGGRPAIARKKRIRRGRGCRGGTRSAA